MTDSGYIGRFAPTPSGRLHFGSMVAAVASWVDARRAGGRWLVRMDDLDPPREVAGAADDILRTLEGFGLTWDGSVLYQSSRHEAYEEALRTLKERDLVFGCRCSRRDLEGHGLYPGTCDSLGLDSTCSMRLRATAAAATVQWHDAGCGPQSYDVANEIGAFIVKRGDGHWGYQLACAVDDSYQGITHVVRGADLLDSTAHQRLVKQALGLSQSTYHHVALAYNSLGNKLSKQTAAPPVEVESAPEVLAQVFEHLGWPRVDFASPREMLERAVES